MRQERSPNRGRSRRGCIGLLLALGLSTVTVADPPPLDWDKIEAGYIPSPDQVRDFLAQFDAKLDEAKVKTATLSARFPATRDERGRSIQDDWRDYVLTESSLAKIAAERRVIAEAIDGYRWFDATAALRRLRVHMLRELRTMQAITQYWQQLGDHAPRFEPYRAMLKENSLTPHYEQNLSSLERTFQLQIEHGLFDVAMNYTIPRMWALRARAARLDGNALERLGDLPDEKRLYPMAANSSCLREASASSGSASVKLDPNRSVPSLEYPV